MPTEPEWHTAEQVGAELQRRWDEVLPGQSELGARLIARYAEPHRRYHGQRHLLEVLEGVDAFATRQDLFLVRLAVYFHDAVYAVPAGQVTNEEASARLVLRELGRVGLEQEDLNQVARLVRVTADHTPGSRDPEGALICDADLAVLGGSPQSYAAYVAGIEAEYASVPREAFARGRLAVLTALLEGDIYRTTKGRMLGDRARANVEAECEALARELGVEFVPPL